MVISDIIKRQVGFQQNMRSNTQVMKLALIEELGEYVASMGFADWKQVERDEANMDIELIDIAVFAINIAYYEDEINYLDPILANFHVISELDLVDEIVKLYAEEKWLQIAYTIFAHKIALTDVIVAKQALNKLRQDYGYKTGDYVKDWNGQEDNAYLSGLYGLDYGEIYLRMEDIYTTKIIASRLVDA